MRNGWLHRMRGSLKSRSLLGLQQQNGNQFVQRLVAPGSLQGKLKVGQPGDIYEQQADEVADAVMKADAAAVRQPTPEEEKKEKEEKLHAKKLSERADGTARNHGLQRQSEEEEGEMAQAKLHADHSLHDSWRERLQRQEEEEEETAQMKSVPGQSAEVGENVESQINQVVNSGGQPLSSADRADFESRFNHDFQQVRVHNDAESSRAAKSLNARAFTLGRDVVFGEGQYTPGTSEGKRLLAHELAHVVQQDGSERSSR